MALIHIDLRKELSSTIKLAVIGVALLTILNSFRIVILIWIGYVGGAAAFWDAHNWIGYALFLGFCTSAILAYSHMGPREEGRTTLFGA